ncbi:MAG: tRNA (adenosine(37)-N6)-threonylcarbamoyltransferase complex ATPase subunit type 1 TsaE [Candidatus Magnetomorum sp.]|nr:tRNA (adenosine(37)-N6)-threonylcarbamoyltransferase complex ATPase subunit type 1 TsaE [Candidatus Magnetomorum sp.]
MIKKNFTTIIETHSPEETVHLGYCIGKSLYPGHVVALIGHLGAGKTWLSRGIAKGLGISKNHHVHSPAFDLVHEHPGTIPMYHMDFYRLDHFSREDELWIEEYIHSDTGVCVIEWADKFIKDLLDDHLEIHLEMGGCDTDRKISLIAVGDEYYTIMDHLLQLFYIKNKNINILDKE